MRKIDGNKLMQMNETLASYLQEGRLEEADKLDAEMIQYCGTAHGDEVHPGLQSHVPLLYRR